MIDRIERLFARRSELEALLSSPEITSDMKKMEDLGREYNRINRDMPLFNRYCEVVRGIADSRAMLKSESDPDLIAMAREEVTTLEEELPNLEKYLVIQPISKMPWSKFEQVPAEQRLVFLRPICIGCTPVLQK